MSWSEPGGESWDEPQDPGPQLEATRWPMSPTGLCPRERRLWFEQLYDDVCMLRNRYRLSVRSGWWEDQIQIETLAALAAWVERYDSGEWDDPPGKLGLLYDLERVGALLRDGKERFDSERDRPAFARHLIEIGCEPPPVRPHDGSG